MHRRDVAGVETTAIDRLVSLNGKRVLDVGCGDGRLTGFAAARASEVYAFDPNAERLSEARAALTDEQRGRVRFAAHSAEALDLPRERFDIALCGWSLWCVPLESVVNALRNIHAVLAAGGVVVDTQPVSPTPRVLAGGEDLGSLDMRAWAGTIQAVDERTKTVVSEGRFELEHEERFVVVDSFDGGRACLDTAGTWRDTSVPRALAWRLEQTSGLVTVEQEVRLRLLRRTG